MEESKTDNVIFGRNPVREALRSGAEIDRVILTNADLTPPLKEIFALAREKKIPVQRADRRGLDRLSEDGNHQGVAAVVAATEYSTVEDILAYAEEKGEPPFLILLDGIEDPHNLGSIIRSAECAGAHGVIIPKQRAVGVTPTVVRVSSGAAEYMRVARVQNLNNLIDDIKKQGVWVAGADMGGEDYKRADLSGAMALVIGAEGKGISRLTREKCDMIISLPVMGRVDSLNAAVAAGILMYEIRSRRDG